MDTSQVKGPKKQASTKVDVDSLPVAFSAASPTLKGCISLVSCPKQLQHESLERLESALSYDHFCSSFGLAI